jgi:hypothetical protein
MSQCSLTRDRPCRGDRPVSDPMEGGPTSPIWHDRLVAPVISRASDLSEAWGWLSIHRDCRRPPPTAGPRVAGVAERGGPGPELCGRGWSRRCVAPANRVHKTAATQPLWTQYAARAGLAGQPRPQNAQGRPGRPAARRGTVSSSAHPWRPRHIPAPCRRGRPGVAAGPELCGRGRSRRCVAPANRVHKTAATQPLWTQYAARADLARQPPSANPKGGRGTGALATSRSGRCSTPDKPTGPYYPG